MSARTARSIAAPACVAYAIAALAGCLQPGAHRCDDGGVCPGNLQCGRAGNALVCVPPPCGDGIRDPGEACDDGNNVSGDGCPADCSAPCGDGQLDPGEVCDDGNTLDGDGCSADCRSTELCGNGVPDPGEQCDQAGPQFHLNCSNRCLLEIPSWNTDAVPAGGETAMAYDVARGVAVMLVSPSPPTFGNPRTYEWDGAAWREGNPPMAPYVFAGQSAMIYDSDRRRVVLFGDFGAQRVPRYARSAWEWDGARWIERIDTAIPPPLWDYAMAYDTARHRAVLFGGTLPDDGGVFAGGYQDRTWEWDGTTWQEIATAVRPAKRVAHAMAYDSVRGAIVMYGGVGPEGLLHDTWEYDGHAWRLRSQSGPPRSWYHRMAFDAARGRIVSFGGFGPEYIDVPTPGDTWEWDGTQWEMRPGAAALEARFRPGMAFDIARGKLVVFGGQLNYNGFPDLQDTWQRSGDSWSQPAMRTLPPARSHHAMVYEWTRRTTVMFGGIAGNGDPASDTWVWGGADWQRPVLSRSPEARADHAMAHDIARARTVLFGGTGSSGQLLADTWEWDGTGWLERHPAQAPLARSGHAMVYDAAHGRLLLIGGVGGGTTLTDHWAWDGVQWADVTPELRPPGRSEFAVAYDADRKRIVLFGGQGASALLDDLWEWDGSQWRDVTPAVPARPAARAGHTLFYDAALHSVVLFGGRGASGRLDDTWAWDGANWISLTPTPAFAPVVPLPRAHHAAVYDSILRRPIVFGGDEAMAVTGELWFLRFGDPAPRDEACETGLDGDGDGLRGCDDPDCEASCIGCGNGVCDGVEDCHLCPGDCGACNLCGDLQCDPGETCSSCPGDCGPCSGAVSTREVAR